jgi:hypothetical protein
MSVEEYEKMSATEQKKEDWMNSKWRPAMGWLYLVVCSADFVVFPIMWSVLQGLFHGTVNTQWQPLTLQGAGLFHIAMGAIIGVAAWGRTQEKLGGANNGGIQLPANVGTTYQPPGSVLPAMTPNTVPVAGPASTGFGSGFNTPTPAPMPSSMPTPTTTGFGGRLAPIQPPQPII